MGTLVHFLYIFLKNKGWSYQLPNIKKSEVFFVLFCFVLGGKGGGGGWVGWKGWKLNDLLHHPKPPRLLGLFSSGKIHVVSGSG